VNAFQTAVADARRAAARDAIINVAIELFSDEGFENVSIEDVAHAVGISTRSFYRYFPSREQVLIDFALRSAGYLPRAIAQAAPTDRRLEALLRAASDWDETTERAFWTYVKITKGLAARYQYVESSVHAGFRRMVTDALDDRWPGHGDNQLLAYVAVAVLDCVSDDAVETNLDRHAKLVEAIDTLRAALIGSRPEPGQP
jgi:AcrR family transcriptional regulator